MAYQKLQGYRAWSVNKSDNTDIPNIMIAGPSGTTTSAATKQLIDSNANFTAETVQTGMIVVNTTDDTQTTVLSIENTTTLNVTEDIMANAEAYQLVRWKSRRCCVVYWYSWKFKSNNCRW